MINGCEVEFSYKPIDGDRIAVFPSTVGNSMDPKFVVDGHLGRLAAYLRMLGFDTYYETQIEDSQLMTVAVSESRILLSRDRRLLMHKSLRVGYCPRSLNSQDQLREVLVKFELMGKEFFLSSDVSNAMGSFNPVEKQEILDDLLPLTRRYFDEFSMCQECRKVYWKGSHYERMTKINRPNPYLVV